MARKKKSSWTPFLIIVGVVFVIGLFVFFSSDIRLDIDPDTYAYTDDAFDRDGAEFLLVEYGDFQCPACGSYAPVIKEVKETYDNVQVEYRHFVLGSFPYSQEAAEASECARDQNRFWAYHDVLYDHQSRISTSFIRQAAQAIELDMTAFDACVRNREKQVVVTQHIQEARDIGVSATPWILIDGERVQYGSLAQFRAHFS
jgi:protein-disulfide isomerase